jgi:hypothetical protein
MLLDRTYAVEALVKAEPGKLASSLPKGERR